MIIVLGFKTASNAEVPEIVYLGDDGDEANAAIAACPMPRIGVLRNPTLQAERHWTEDAVAAYAVLLAAGPPASVDFSLTELEETKALFVEASRESAELVEKLKLAEAQSADLAVRLAAAEDRIAELNNFPVEAAVKKTSSKKDKPADEPAPDIVAEEEPPIEGESPVSGPTI